MQAPVTCVKLTIRRPPADVFAAFADPAITTRFWFTKSSGKLEAGKRVRWDWEMYGVGSDIDVLALDPAKRIRIRWDQEHGRTEVEWTFEPRGDGHTRVIITESGFGGDADAQIAEALDSTQGFSLTLAAAKAWLEHGIVLRVVEDKAPDAHVEGWRGRA